MHSAIKYVPGLVAFVASIVVMAARAEGLPPSGQDDPTNFHAAVAPVRYESFLPTKRAQLGDTSPADNWKAANLTVASIDAMALTMPMTGDDRAAKPATSAGTAGQHPASPDPHAGHVMGPMSPADPHAGHKMPIRTVESVVPARALPIPHTNARPTGQGKKSAKPHLDDVTTSKSPADAHAVHSAKETK